VPYNSDHHGQKDAETGSERGKRTGTDVSGGRNPLSAQRQKTCRRLAMVKQAQTDPNPPSHSAQLNRDPAPSWLLAWMAQA